MRWEREEISMRDKIMVGLAIVILIGGVLLVMIGVSHAQNRPGLIPDYRDWGPEEQQRRLPPMPRMEERRRYDDRDRYGGGRPIPREQYEQRSYCAMHPQECR